MIYPSKAAETRYLPSYEKWTPWIWLVWSYYNYFINWKFFKFHIKILLIYYKFNINMYILINILKFLNYLNLSLEQEASKLLSGEISKWVTES